MGETDKVRQLRAALDAESSRREKAQARAFAVDQRIKKWASLSHSEAEAVEREAREAHRVLRAACKAEALAFQKWRRAESDKPVTMNEVEMILGEARAVTLARLKAEAEK